jgi:hypothetical protein
VSRSPNKAAVFAIRVGIDGRAAERLTEQARGHRVTAFVDSNPQIVILRSADRRQQSIVVVLDFFSHHQTPMRPPPPAQDKAPGRWPLDRRSDAATDRSQRCLRSAG